MTRILRRAAVIAALATVACYGILAAGSMIEPASAATVAQPGPGGPVWVNGVLNYDSTNGQTMLAAIDGYEQALIQVEQAAIPNNDAPIDYVQVAPWVTALPDGVIGFQVTLGYENAAGRVVGFNEYEAPGFMTVGDWPASSLGLPLFHAEAVLANAWAHWPAS